MTNPATNEEEPSNVPAAVELSTSVLITTYNGERFIEQQLESIRTQTQPASQVLLFDDGSTDGTVARVQAFIDEHALHNWRVEINPRNLGAAANTLENLKHLTGDIVFLADQDDIWDPRKVEVMSRVLASDPNLTMVVSRTRTVDQDGHDSLDESTRRRVDAGRRINRGSRTEAEELTFDDFIGSSTVPLHAMAVRGTVLQEISDAGAFPALSKSLGPDWYFGFWATSIGKCLLIPDELVLRRIHDTNISLGKLRKTTALSATNERRIQMLREARDAHRATLNNQDLAQYLSQSQKDLVTRFDDFLSSRVDFAEHPKVSRSIGLLTDFPLYFRSAGTAAGAARMWVADVMYAYNINWTIKKRA